MTDEKKWKVYCHTNKVNGKKYVGITSQKRLNDRAHSGASYVNCKVFYQAINKYGWDCFESEILATNLPEEKAKELERFYIKLFKTQDRRFGYNVDDGGGTPLSPSEEGMRRKIESATGGNNGGAHPVVAFNLKGERLGEFSCMVDAERHFGFKLNYRHLKSKRGTCHGHIFRFKEDTVGFNNLPEDQVFQRCEQKLIRGENSWHSTPVTVFDAATGEYVKSFSCAKYANEFIGANCSDCLRGKKKSVMGYVCKRSDDVVGITKLPVEELPKYESLGKPVYQYDIDGNFIKSFPNATIAEKETGVSRKTISNCVRSRCYVGGGYLWKLASDDSPLRKPMTAYESSVANGIKNGKSVDQIDLKTGDVVATFLSIGQAAKAVGCSKNSISIVVRHKGNSQSCKGYGWRFHEDHN